MEDKREYSFTYMGKEIKTGSKIEFFGEFFYPDGRRAYGGVWSPCIFKYVVDDVYYIEINGELCYCRDFKKKIHRFILLNGEKNPNPVTEDEVKSGTILLVIIMTVTSIFKGAIGLWIIELIVYFKWVNKKKYN